MTGRRLTSTEVVFQKKRTEILDNAQAGYIADAPFLCATRPAVTAALSRIELFKMATGIPGAIIECGVYRGNSLMLLLHLSHILEPYAINRSIIGFDTFDGFEGISSDHDPEDIDGTMFSDTDPNLIEEMIALTDLVRPVNRIPRCEIVKGDIKSTVPQFVASRPDLIVAMLMLDADLYEPTKVALENFVPLMPKGGLVVFDEIAYRNFPGETVALREYFDLNKVEIQRFPFDASLGYFRL